MTEKTIPFPGGVWQWEEEQSGISKRTGEPYTLAPAWVLYTRQGSQRVSKEAIEAICKNQRGLFG